MSEESEIIAESTGAVVAALAEQSKTLEPIRAAAEYASNRLGLRYAPRLVDRAMAAAAKIKESGLPALAYSEIGDPLLCAILEASAIESDCDLQVVWENLLANAMTDGSASVARAYPRILGDLEPREVRILDALVNKITGMPSPRFVLGDFPGDTTATNIGNLTRIELLEPIRDRVTTLGTISDEAAETVGYRLTYLGWDFVNACQPPRLQI
ncbi:MAG TPA: hypothetical protein VK730_06970 [Solirubrobacteraceae bacterium]|nr:hypothetical protein [Solirubrobacteraceae bacterium]